jgi:hypothetical protein
MGFNDNATTISRSDLIQIKNRAFSANVRAKLSTGETRESCYRNKHAAISYLLAAGMAFVDSVDWSVPDPTFGVEFVGGGKLHTKLSGLSSAALRSVRRQLHGNMTPQSPTQLPEGGLGYVETDGPWN